ncbi:SDR family oxidoreductase [Capillimicrobium parvum]|uniref:SDR family oxidoreductase n=1 Tax=Capillimicrobium parvum TaxID=2884022 RepID=UPI00216B3F14|nr:SDR family oxidoreductase [Capillimicrobium parvum]
MTYDFTGEVVLVTGAARGMGREIAVSFARAGAQVAVNDVDAQVEHVPYATGTVEELAQTVADIEAQGAEALEVRGDLRREADVERMVAATIERFGRLDVLVNNAGVYSCGPVTELTEERWDVVVDTVLKAPFLCSKHAARHMIERGGGGRIVTISSTSALVGIPDQVNYQSAKHGVVGQIRTLALELAPHGVTVNTICPTAVADTAMLDHVIDLGPEYFGKVNALCGASTVFPGLDCIETRDVSHAVRWLASDAARYVTGVVLPVDGGFSCK